MIKKNTLDVLRSPWASDKRYPTPAFADCISEKTTPVKAVAAASLKPLNIDGRADGITTVNTV